MVVGVNVGTVDGTMVGVLVDRVTAADGATAMISLFLLGRVARMEEDITTAITTTINTIASTFFFGRPQQKDASLSSSGGNEGDSSFRTIATSWVDSKIGIAIGVGFEFI